MAITVTKNRGARAAQQPAGHPRCYSAIEKMAKAPPGDSAWIAFVRDFIGMPDWMLPAVQYAVRQRAWTQAVDPVQTVRNVAELKAARMELTPEEQGD
jgi:hypothetical protein